MEVEEESATCHFDEDGDVHLNELEKLSEEEG